MRVDQLIKNESGSFYFTEAVRSSIEKISAFIQEMPAAFKPFRGEAPVLQKIFLEKGFTLYPTVKRTTLFYDQKTDSFFKVIHPIRLKDKITSALGDRAKSIYATAEYLRTKGMKMPVIIAYGRLRNMGTPLIGMRRVEGKSLYDLFIRRNKYLPAKLFADVIETIARLHSLGYWLGDAHLSHIFVDESSVTGLIDIDSIRKNRFFMLKHQAKDLAGLNHPALPLSEDEKNALFRRYTDLCRITERERLIQLFKSYSEQRWKK